jgi:hypothetical protein
MPNDKYRDCTALKTVTFAGTIGLLSIGHRSFMNSGLTSVDIPDNGYMQSQSFRECTDLVSVTIGTRMYSGQNKPFQSNENFRDCTSLTTVTFANEHLIEFIPSSTFWGCTELTINVPSGLTSVYSSSFRDVKYIPSVQLGQISFVSNDAFHGATIGSVNISSITNDIGEDAFDGATIGSLTIDSVGDDILQYAFRDTNISSINIGSVDQINMNAFRTNDGVSGQFGDVYIGTARYIDDYAFMYVNMTSLTIDAVTEKIDPNAFRHASLGSVNLGTIALASSGSFYGADIGSITLGDDCNTILRVFDTGSIKTLNYTGTSISNDLFRNLINIETIHAPLVTSIGDNAFKDTSIQSYTFGDLVTIGAYAFRAGENVNFPPLRSFVIPDSVTSIGANAFQWFDDITLPCCVSTDFGDKMISTDVTTSQYHLRFTHGAYTSYCAYCLGEGYYSGKYYTYECQGGTAVRTNSGSYATAYNTNYCSTSMSSYYCRISCVSESNTGSVSVSAGTALKSITLPTYDPNSVHYTDLDDFKSKVNAAWGTLLTGIDRPIYNCGDNFDYDDCDRTVLLDTASCSGLVDEWVNDDCGCSA